MNINLIKSKKSKTITSSLLEQHKKTFRRVNRENYRLWKIRMKKKLLTNVSSPMNAERVKSNEEPEHNVEYLKH